ncbi:MAG: hypothetical protein HC888_14685 [Candidatus Competibacteraceae bacterium]|nr:hypothetical protein [Candidatus Competibacteraceae bacterium]
MSLRKTTSEHDTKSGADKKGTKAKAQAQKKDAAAAYGPMFTLSIPKNQNTSSRRLVKNSMGNMVLEIEDNSHAEGLLGLEAAGFVPAPELFTSEMVYHAPPAAQLLKLAQNDFQELTQKGIRIASETKSALSPIELDEEIWNSNLMATMTGGFPFH